MKRDHMRSLFLVSVMVLGFLTYLLPNVLASNTQGSCNLVKNGSFEQGPNPGSFITLKIGNSSINSWQVTQLSVDYIGTYFASADGKRHLDMTGTPGGGAVTQTIKTQSGKAYKLSFSMAGNPQCAPDVKKLSVQAGSASQIFTHGNNTQWKIHTLPFTASASQTAITFTSIDSPDGYCGALLDNVSVVAADEKQEDMQGFTGEWSTTWGKMILTDSNSGKLAGNYTHDKGRLQGSLSPDGRSAKGWWYEYPSYKGDTDSGRFVFQLAPDGKTFTGSWGYGDSLNNGDWKGTRVVNESACNSIEPIKDSPSSEGCNQVFKLNRSVPPPVSYDVLSQ